MMIFRARASSAIKITVLVWMMPRSTSNHKTERVIELQRNEQRHDLPKDFLEDRMVERIQALEHEALDDANDQPIERNGHHRADHHGEYQSDCRLEAFVDRQRAPIPVHSAPPI